MSDRQAGRAEARPRLLRLVASDMQLRAERAPSFAAHLDGELVVRSAQPLYDGARELLARGYDPEALLTLRHDYAETDSFKPKPIGELARWTVHERADRGLQLCKWSPMPERLTAGAPERASRPRAGVTTGADEVEASGALAPASWPIVLNGRWRVVDDPIEWILERRDVIEGKEGWQPQRFHRMRRVLLRDIAEVCGEVAPQALAQLRALPEMHP